MLKTHRRSERKGTLRKKMAAVKEDYFFGDDLEAILSAIDDNILDENEEFASEINAVVEEITHHLLDFHVICVTKSAKLRED